MIKVRKRPKQVAYCEAKGPLLQKKVYVEVDHNKTTRLKPPVIETPILELNNSYLNVFLGKIKTNLCLRRDFVKDISEEINLHKPP